jgi:hypothetical protein
MYFVLLDNAARLATSLKNVAVAVVAFFITVNCRHWLIIVRKVISRAKAFLTTRRGKK